MSEAETIELVALLGDNAVSNFAVYISITFAYLTVAYFVGAALSSFQMKAVSGLYLASSGICAISSVATVQAWVLIVSVEPTVLNTLPLYTAGIWHIYMAVLLTAGMVVSLYFMYDIRRRGNEKSDKTPS